MRGINNTDDAPAPPCTTIMPLRVPGNTSAQNIRVINDYGKDNRSPTVQQCPPVPDIGIGESIALTLADLVPRSWLSAGHWSHSSATVRQPSKHVLASGLSLVPTSPPGRRKRFIGGDSGEDMSMCSINNAAIDEHRSSGPG